jgi:hypothetical protein
MLAGAQAHADDVQFPIQSAHLVADDNRTHPSLSITSCDIRFPVSSQRIASGRTTSLTNLRIAFWNRRWVSLWYGLEKPALSHEGSAYGTCEFSSTASGLIRDCWPRIVPTCRRAYCGRWSTSCRCKPKNASVASLPAIFSSNERTFP